MFVVPAVHWQADQSFNSAVHLLRSSQLMKPCKTAVSVLMTLSLSLPFGQSQSNPEHSSQVGVGILGAASGGNGLRPDLAHGLNHQPELGPLFIFGQQISLRG